MKKNKTKNNHQNNLIPQEDTFKKKTPNQFLRSYTNDKQIYERTCMYVSIQIKRIQWKVQLMSAMNASRINLIENSKLELQLVVCIYFRIVSHPLYIHFRENKPTSIRSVNDAKHI